MTDVYCKHRWGDVAKAPRPDWFFGRVSLHYRLCAVCGEKWYQFRDEPKVAIGEF
jgi:hypothetical protein